MRPTLAAVALLAVVAAPIRASAPPEQSHAPVAPADSTHVARAVRTARPPVIDGRDDDPVWRRAPAYSDFLEFQPKEGGRARFRTEFRAAYDDRNLYVFIRAFDPHPDSIMHALSRHDVRGPSDQLKVMIDSYHDRRSGYEFSVNPDGVKRDYSMSGDGNEDDSWNGVWYVASRVDSLGWTAEYRIPFSQLRFENTATHTFGFAIWRDIERFKERTSWPLYRASRNGLVSQLGELTGIDSIAAPGDIEFTPYVVARNSDRPTSAAFQRVQQETVGGDLKYGVTPNLTLDATVNPDFGQVEADPSVLNLSAFETFFPEKRPFFIEGAGLYKFAVNCNSVNCGNEGLFYSRRIGRSPQLLGNYGDATSPTATPISAAAKLTGRLPSGLSIGALDAVTPSVDGTLNRTIEPHSNYALVRLQQDLHHGASGFSFLGTAVNRATDQWTSGTLRNGAYVGAADFRHRFLRDQYEVSGSLAASRVEGSAAVIAATQQNAVHYYQQPDAPMHLDTTRTSLSGDAEDLRVGKYGGGITRFQTSYQRQSAGFEPNDLGFLRRADQQSWSTWGALTFRTPRWFYRSLQINGNQWNQWTSGGLRLENAYNTNVHIQFTNNWWLHAGGTLGQQGDVYCDRCTRGGPAMRASSYVAPWFGFDGDDRRPVIPHLFANFVRTDGGRTHRLDVNPTMDVKVSTQLQTSFGIDVFRNHDHTQWYSNVAGSAGITHYAFAHLEQQAVSLTARFTYTATPNLTLEFYGQPFVTTGDYSDVRQLSATPRATDYDARFAPYTLPAGSATGFAFRQLRSNTVVRWEYRPGSTLFVAWAHGRSDFENQSVGGSWGSQYGQLFELHPDNTFLVKLAYWLER